MSRPDNIWSRRRALVLAEAEAEQQTAERAEALQADARLEADLAGKSDAEILMKLNLKDPGQLQQGDDFASYMLAGVPERLRKRALRILWRSNPVLACVDDLVDYGDDFKAEWDGAELIKTVYRVGKGMLRDEETPVPAPEEPEITETTETPETPEEMAMASAAPAPGPDIERPIAADEEPSQQIEPDTPLRRRMRFEFSEAS